MDLEKRHAGADCAIASDGCDSIAYFETWRQDHFSQGDRQKFYNPQPSQAGTAKSLSGCFWWSLRSWPQAAAASRPAGSSDDISLSQHHRSVSERRLSAADRNMRCRPARYTKGVPGCTCRLKGGLATVCNQHASQRIPIFFLTNTN